MGKTANGKIVNNLKMKNNMVLIFLACFVQLATAKTQCDVGYEVTYCRDLDADGYGDPVECVSACEAPQGYVDNDKDCYDEDPEFFYDWFRWHIGTVGDNHCRWQNESCMFNDEPVLDLLYADKDGDGFGDPYDTKEFCPGVSSPGWVYNTRDCDDNDPDVFGGDHQFMGTPCPTGSGCLGNLDNGCDCVTSDHDNDGVCDGIDICEYEDDSIDEDGNGVPDCSERVCYIVKSSFSTDKLTIVPDSYDNTVSEVTKELWYSNAHKVWFTVYDINYRLSTYADKVTISYKDNYSNVYEDAMVMTWNELKVINEGKSHKDMDDWVVVIDGPEMGWNTYKYVAEITVKLENLVEGSDRATEVTLSEISYCGNKEDWETQNASLLEVEK